MPTVQPPGFVERQSGLVAPVGTLVTKDRVMARKKFLRLVRIKAFCRQEGLIAEFKCERCHEPLTLTRGTLVLGRQQLIRTVDPKHDAFTVTCRCTTRTVR